MQESHEVLSPVNDFECHANHKKHILYQLKLGKTIGERRSFGLAHQDTINMLMAVGFQPNNTTDASEGGLK